jgi:arylamine N-acetyltransferase
VHHQYSSSVSPFQANTGTPCGSRRAVRADDDRRGAWSWVEKMLQEAQRTSAPSSTSVSMSTAVCTVMCSEPVMRAPASGCVAVLLAHRHQAGHLVLGEADLLAAGLGEREVGDLEVR